MKKSTIIRIIIKFGTFLVCMNDPSLLIIWAMCMVLWRINYLKKI